ncbi:Sporulation related domain-containing protein [Allopseudospirillum japonicum]|uniref:Sporulation related domain-containing protein n=1 Tax=Allopseudospirillum japonicum TaxID=64971 RepID=A0A1H6QW99_9GAMM|nr:AAA family ATPase [Allopseudospirillum japonicum]SEI47889.1 Sporulation related domain-containing protein [Allopseudospirillum japonicum]
MRHTSDNKHEPMVSEAQGVGSAYEMLKALDGQEDTSLFATKQYSKYLDLLAHLSRYSNLMLVVTGAQGSGKTTLQTRLLEGFDQSIQAHALDAAHMPSAAQLLANLGKHLHLPLSAKADVLEYVEQIKSHCQHLQDMGSNCLIILDNAHELRHDALNLLLELAVVEDDSQRPHLLMFARPELMRLLTSPANLTRYEAVGHHLELLPLTESEARVYLQQRCRAAGLTSLPLNETQFDHLFRQSSGNPLRLNQLLLEFLRKQRPQAAVDEIPAEPDLQAQAASLAASMGAAKAQAAPKAAPSMKADKKPAPKKAAPKKKSNRPIPFWHIGAVVLVALVVIALFMFRDDLDTGKNLELELAIKPPSRPLEVVDPIRSEPDLDNEQDFNDIPRPSSSLSQPELNLPPEPKPVILEQPEPPPAPKPAPKPEPQPVVAPPKPAPTPAATNTSTNNDYKREQALLQAPKNHYTLQMLGTQDEQGAIRFIQSQADKSELSYFEGRYNGKPWFVVVYGNYDSRDAAVKAIEALSADLQSRKPWARSFASVHKDIQSR